MGIRYDKRGKKMWDWKLTIWDSNSDSEIHKIENEHSKS